MDANTPPRKVVTIDEERHARIRMESARRKVTQRDLVELMIDYTLPRLERDELKIDEPAISGESREAPTPEATR